METPPHSDLQSMKISIQNSCNRKFQEGFQVQVEFPLEFECKHTARTLTEIGNYPPPFKQPRGGEVANQKSEFQAFGRQKSAKSESQILKHPK